MITSITLDGIPLAPKYLSILSGGLSSNTNLTHLSLARCRIGDTGCDILLGALLNNPNLSVLNLSACCLSGRCAAGLTLFLRKRKVKLLQNDWKESNLMAQEITHRKGCTGLRTLTLNRNSKFSNNGVRQLTNVLKDDFWLKVLNLRRCGITKDGGEMLLELLRTNGVLTIMDLKDNDIPNDMLHIIRKILNRRQAQGERIPRRKRLLSSINRSFCNNTDLATELVSNYYKNNVEKIKRKGRDSNITRKVLKIQATSKNLTNIRCSSNYKNSKERRSSKKRKRRNMASQNCMYEDQLRDLNLRLTNIVNWNKNLHEELKNSNELLLVENDRRLEAEKMCEEMKPQIDEMKNKVMSQNALHARLQCETQTLTNLKGVFQSLESCSNWMRPNRNKRVLEERVVETIDAASSMWAYKNKVTCRLQRRPHCLHR